MRRHSSTRLSVSRAHLDAGQFRCARSTFPLRRVLLTAHSPARPDRGRWAGHAAGGATPPKLQPLQPLGPAVGRGHRARRRLVVISAGPTPLTGTARTHSSTKIPAEPAAPRESARTAERISVTLVEAVTSGTHEPGGGTSTPRLCRVTVVPPGWETSDMSA